LVFGIFKQAIENISKAMLTVLKEFQIDRLEDIGKAADAFSLVFNDSVRVTETSTVCNIVFHLFSFVHKIYSDNTCFCDINGCDWSKASLNLS